MRRIPLSIGRHAPTEAKHYALVDNDDYKTLRKFAWTFRALKKRGGYAYRVRYGETILMHRQIMVAGLNETVTHKDKNGLNNQRLNLIKHTGET